MTTPPVLSRCSRPDERPVEQYSRNEDPTTGRPDENIASRRFGPPRPIADLLISSGCVVFSPGMVLYQSLAFAKVRLEANARQQWSKLKVKKRRDGDEEGRVRCAGSDARPLGAHGTKTTHTRQSLGSLPADRAGRVKYSVCDAPIRAISRRIANEDSHLPSTPSRPVPSRPASAAKAADAQKHHPSSAEIPSPD